MRSIAWPTLALSALLLSACDVLTDEDTGAGGVDGWEQLSHPCFGNRTDALWFDDVTTGYVGCGSTTEGYGLYVTTDGGGSWDSADSWFDDMRVNSISRGPDGLLYVGGTGSNGARVVSLSDGGAIEGVHESQSQTWNSFHVGTFRINSDGYAVSESLTGVDVAYTPGDGESLSDGYGWWDGHDSGSVQILDLEVHDGQFYGVGSTISQPPYVFLPPAGGLSTGDPFAMQLVDLSGGGVTAYNGELWSLDIDSDGTMVVGGVDQSRGAGMVHVSGSDPSDPGTWTTVDVAELASSGADNATWIRGVCIGEGLVMAVGEYSQRSDPLAMVSTDGGATWSLVTPPGDGAPLSQCQVMEDGSVYVVGAEGFFGIYAR